MRRFLASTMLLLLGLLAQAEDRVRRIGQRASTVDSIWIEAFSLDVKLDTMLAADGAGLAAPQIGVDLQVVIFGSDSINPRYPQAPVVPRTVLINPVLTPLAPAGDLSPTEVEDWEGCLSVPGLRGKVPRFERIHFAGFDQFGDPVERTVAGFHARVVQHECDHLIGKLYPMRVRDFTQFGFTSELLPELARP